MTVFFSGDGNDDLNGEAGVDTFQLELAGADSIIDFVSRTDNLAVSASDFGAGLTAGQTLGSMFQSNTSGQAEGAEDGLIYNRSTGELFFDKDGTGAEARVLVTVFLDAGQVPVASDFLVI